MIISSTPYRISFFGGGTDYPAWYELHGGAVLSTTINRYCNIQARVLPPFFEHKYRVVWSKIETPIDSSQIEHPSVRAAIEHLGIEQGLEITIPQAESAGLNREFRHDLAELPFHVVTSSGILHGAGEEVLRDADFDALA